MLLLNIVKTRGERVEEGRVKRQQEVWKGRRSIVRMGTLNIEAMTGKGRELADMMSKGM